MSVEILNQPNKVKDQRNKVQANPVIMKQQNDPAGAARPYYDSVKHSDHYPLTNARSGNPMQDVKSRNTLRQGGNSLITYPLGKYLLPPIIICTK